MEIDLTRPSCLDDPDVILIDRVAVGDEDALRSLYATHARRLLAHAFQVTHDQTVAEEVLQDSLLAVWREARSFRGESRVSTWLLGIVHRQALTAIRRKRLPIAELDEAGGLADGSVEPAEAVERTERQRVLHDALARLSPEHRTTLELVFYHGLSLAEVAEVCGCPVGTVKSRISYAKSRLRDALGQSHLQQEDLL